MKAGGQIKRMLVSKMLIRLTLLGRKFASEANTRRPFAGQSQMRIGSSRNPSTVTHGIDVSESATPFLWTAVERPRQAEFAITGRNR